MKLRPALAQSESHRVPTVASGCCPRVVPPLGVASLDVLDTGVTTFSAAVQADPRLSNEKGCHLSKPALRVLRIPVLDKRVLDNPFSLMRPAI